MPSGSTKDADGRQRRPQFEDVADPSAPSSHSRRRGGGGGGGGSRVTTATSTASSKREALASIDARSWITSAGGGRYAPPAYASTAPIGRARPDYYSPYPYSTSPSPPPSPELSEMASLEGPSATSPPDRASISPGLARRPREAAYPYANNKTAVGVGGARGRGRARQLGGRPVAQRAQAGPPLATCARADAQRVRADATVCDRRKAAAARQILLGHGRDGSALFPLGVTVRSYSAPRKVPTSLVRDGATARHQHGGAPLRAGAADASDDAQAARRRPAHLSGRAT